MGTGFLGRRFGTQTHFVGADFTQGTLPTMNAHAAKYQWENTGPPGRENTGRAGKGGKRRGLGHASSRVPGGQGQTAPRDP